MYIKFRLFIGWLFSHVEFRNMFSGCSIVELIPNIGQWETSHITSLNKMFFRASKFNDDLSGWTLGSVSGSLGLSRVFFEARLFNSAINNWDVSTAP